MRVVPARGTNGRVTEVKIRVEETAEQRREWRSGGADDAEACATNTDDRRRLVCLRGSIGGSPSFHSCIIVEDCYTTPTLRCRVGIHITLTYTGQRRPSNSPSTQ